MAQNLAWVSLGNIIGGALFVGGAYAATCTHQRRCEQETSTTVTEATRQSA